ncbi:class I SAM-dependent methyltransferase [Nocardia cyriacigeorgica]|jgi:SAM-dependent methyltransferase|uniref:class I SAM-dependent methyltransferase n=1 Tax=Nocardia cyriacigeorgica TaxID=135487 RepID=UPI0013D3347B|nr:class I SAM-dependent methyltransferase [Nocardia cyriacigeorgica]MBF6439354.1 class I SAM-dependent methyltransferase [Nocardia cyriacigeorgica]MBF6455614.1 class I SAM-dependent methyltransferase [Nocardia cyriacigeorgica]MBF6477518.1 class I SAM-dependent methyltransferase [Nocardia cyriacigeorgica]MBF6553644.1 class I SAM-dependent methyltransferase [Nocardia cyriacigeorgica]NEW28206.1 class I SAM-dependent methyltransferase [Nocardia cyriacigeorgica]
MTEEFGKEFWETRYHGAHSAAREPNPHLLAEVGDLPPGTALDAGCGTGGEALWLAAQGWQVMAVDISDAALRHARERADAAGADIAARISWQQADLTEWVPPAAQFDLVCTHYVHTSGSPQELFERLATAVAPGGTLLIVGHAPSDHLSSHAHGSSSAHVHVTAEDIAAGLDPGRWEVQVAEGRSRQTIGPNGSEVTLEDTVLRARRR